MPNLLLLEPDQLLSASIKKYFGSVYSVHTHSDPQAAILAADKNTPDVVILDLMLAGRSGIEFLYELRSYPDWQKIPVIVWSSLWDEEIEPYLPTFSELQVSATFYKPATSLSELSACIEKLLQPAAV